MTHSSQRQYKKWHYEAYAIWVDKTWTVEAVDVQAFNQAEAEKKGQRKLKQMLSASSMLVAIGPTYCCIVADE